MRIAYSCLWSTGECMTFFYLTFSPWIQIEVRQFLYNFAWSVGDESPFQA